MSESVLSLSLVFTNNGSHYFPLFESWFSLLVTLFFNLPHICCTYSYTPHCLCPPAADSRAANRGLFLAGGWGVGLYDGWRWCFTPLFPPSLALSLIWRMILRSRRLKDRPMQVRSDIHASPIRIFWPDIVHI